MPRLQGSHCRTHGCAGACETALLELGERRPHAALHALSQDGGSRGPCPFATSLRAFASAGCGKHEQALQAAEGAIVDHGTDPVLTNHLGLALEGLGRTAEASKAFAACLALDRGFTPAAVSLGYLLFQAGRLTLARAMLEGAIARGPRWALPHVHLASILEAQGDREGRCEQLEAAFALDPDSPYLRGDLLNARLAVAKWQSIGPALQEAREALALGESVVSPWVALTLFDDPPLQKRAARTWTADLDRRPADAPPWTPPLHREGPLHIGYFSPDFREHAVGRFVEGLLREHPRDNLRITGFSFGPRNEDARRARIAAMFDEFVELDDTDPSFIERARSAHLDIAVDLCGFTANNRATAFRSRIAPLQVGFLGYAGTCGEGTLDYLVADHVLVPASERESYAEKLIRLPTCVLGGALRGERRRAPDIRHAAPFRFCCTVALEKILPAQFAGWLRILARVPHAELWLKEAPPKAQQRLRDACTDAGLDPARLCFQTPLPEPEFEAWLGSMDLYLDTHPYNAHSSASDALWAGVPVLTRAGRSYASRVAASLLETAGLPALVTNSPQGYEDLAAALAQAPERLSELRQKLDRIGRQPPFDPRVLAAGLVDGLRRAGERNRAGLMPTDIDVNPPA